MDTQCTNYQPGTRYRIKRLSADINPSFRNKLIAMGLIPGAEFAIVRIAPLGDPIELAVHDFCLSLRATELHQIEAEELA